MAANTLVKVLNIQLNYTSVVDGLGKLQGAIKQCDDEMKTLKQMFKDGAITLDEYGREAGRLVESKKYLREEISRLSSAMQNNINQNKLEAGSIDQMVSKLEALKVKYKALSESQRTGSKGAKLASDIKDLDAKIKDAMSAISNFKNNTTSVVDSILGMKNALAKLKDEYSKLSKTDREGQVGEGLRSQINSLQSQVKQAESAMKMPQTAAKGSIDELKQSLEQATKAYNALSEAERKDEQVGGKLREQITRLNSAIKSEKDALEQTKKAVSTSIDSIAGMRARLSQLTKEYDNLSKADRKSSTGKTLRKDINNLTKELKKAEEATGRFKRNVGNYMSAVKGFFTKGFLNMALGVTTIAQAFVKLGNAIKDGVSTATEFNQSISKLQAITGASKKQVSELAAEARRLGATTRYTAQEVTELEVELAKLGFKKGQILNMTEDVLHFAQAVGTDLASAAQLAGSTLRMFNLTSADTGAVVDQLSAATSKSALSFDYLKTALPIVGSVAQTYGFKLSDTVSLLGTLANAGVDASMAATATRNIFLRLADANSDLVKTIGYTPKNLKELGKALLDLKNKGMNLNDALQLTDKRSVNAFTRFAEGSKDAMELAEALENVNGKASEMAKVMEDNLGGDIKALGSAWDEFMISLNGSQGILRETIQALTGIVRWMGLIVKSSDDSIAEVVARESTKYSKYSEIYKQDLEEYDRIKKELTDKGVDEATARSEAQERVIKKLLDEKAALDVLAESERNYIEILRNKYPDLRDKTVEDLKELVEQGNEEAKLMLEAINKYAIYMARLNGIDTRLEKLNASTNTNKEKKGLGITPDKRVREIEQAEKQAEKLLMDAEKAYNQSVLKTTKDGQEAELLAIKDGTGKIIAEYTNRGKKAKAEIDAQYQAEINALQLKIDQEAKITKKDSQKSKAQKLEAAKILNEVITQKYIEWGIETERLYWKEVESYANKEKDRIQKIMEGFDISTSDNQDEDLKKMYENRLAIVEQEHDAELAAFEMAAMNDLEIAEHKAEMLEAIENKYTKKRIALIHQEMDERQKILISAMQAEAAITYDDEEKAKVNASIKEKIVEDMYRKQGETAESFALRQAQAQDELNKAYDEVTKKRIEKTQKLWEIASNQTVTDIDQARLAAEQTQDYLKQVIAAGQLRTETEEDFALRVSQAWKNAYDSRKALADKEFELMSSTASSISSMFGEISSAIQDCSEETKDAVKISKILSLASVYLAQGVAIANAIKNASQSSITVWDMAAQIGAGIATVVSSTVQAISSIKKASFAKGGVNIQGPGTSTSDSINARISTGESVMTAKATKMFGGLLTIMNEVASQPSYTLPTMYSTYNAAQMSADRQVTTDAFKEAAQEIKPVVSVKEITDVSNRVSAIESLDTI